VKTNLSTTAVLVYPKFNLPFILTTDASKVAVVGILSQKQEKRAELPMIADKPIRLSNLILRQNQKCWATMYFKFYLVGFKICG
jgi:hypothetical protein